MKKLRLKLLTFISRITGKSITLAAQKGTSMRKHGKIKKYSLVKILRRDGHGRSGPDAPPTGSYGIVMDVGKGQTPYKISFSGNRFMWYYSPDEIELISAPKITRCHYFAGEQVRITHPASQRMGPHYPRTGEVGVIVTASIENGERYLIFVSGYPMYWYEAGEFAPYHKKIGELPLTVELPANR